jgi:hypothetical protein
VFENKINLYVDKGMNVWVKRGRKFRVLAMKGRRKEDSG